MTSTNPKIADIIKLIKLIQGIPTKEVILEGEILIINAPLMREAAKRNVKTNLFVLTSILLRKFSRPCISM